MQFQNRFLDDLARVFGGALGTAAGVKREIDELIRLRLERLFTDMNLVAREEFDAVQEMAAKARVEQERLAARLAALEAAVAGPKRPSKAGAAKNAAPRGRQPEKDAAGPASEP